MPLRPPCTPRLRRARVPPAAAAALLVPACAGRARLLAGSAVGHAIRQADRNTGAGRILVDGPDDRTDGIASDRIRPVR